MYQVFVVEDELLIRQSIHHMVDTMGGPYVCCGEASDGEMALSMMQDLMPDILLTDIRMPFLDGFELIRNVRSMMPWVKIIIISGYGDFDYTQKAIALGANQYLLKPVRAPELTQAIREVTAQLEQEKAASRLPSGYDENEMKHMLHQHFMLQLLSGTIETGLMLERARNLQLDIIHPLYQVVIFSFDTGEQNAAAIPPAMLNLLNTLSLSLYYFNGSESVTVLIGASSPEQLNEETYRIINIIRHQMQELAPVITTIVGNVVNRLSRVCQAYGRSRDLLRNVIAIAAGQVIDVEDTSSITNDYLNYSMPFGSEFQRELLQCSVDEVHALLHDYMEQPESAQFNSMLFRYQTLVDLLKCCMRVQLRHQSESDVQRSLAQLDGEKNLLTAAFTREGFEQTAEELMVRIVREHNDGVVAAQIPPVVARADSYLAEHFCDPNISLIRVAKAVGLSAAHFSTVFSQAHGISFISYLTDMRIERAKKLLLETDMKLAAIAMEIGYNEPNYFSHVFRKTEGMTPKEYRLKNMREI